MLLYLKSKKLSNMSLFKRLVTKSLLIIGSIVNLVDFIIIVHKYNISNMHTVIHSELFWYFMFIFSLFIIGIIYIFIHDLLSKIYHLERTLKMVCAINRFNLDSNIIQSPTKKYYEMQKMTEKDLYLLGFSNDDVNNIVNSI